MVYLVGAGPGDSGLITQKGLECIKKADVIIYDHLANPTLLSYEKNDCKLIYAGKIAGNHHMVQEEINKTLVEHSRFGNVVRLKGGDPFIFGRGGEEIIALIRNCTRYFFLLQFRRILRYSSHSPRSCNFVSRYNRSRKSRK